MTTKKTDENIRLFMKYIKLVKPKSKFAWDDNVVNFIIQEKNKQFQKKIDKLIAELEVSKTGLPEDESYGWDKGINWTIVKIKNILKGD
ncbi:MAG: hypothetical protein ACTSVB_07870 [Candidatus Heimdallarchaeaceae archaeon]